MVLGTFLFAQSLHDSLQRGLSGEPRNHWPDRGPSNGAVIFYEAEFSAKLRRSRFVLS